MADANQKPPRSRPSITGTLLENPARKGIKDCLALGFARIAGTTYRIRLYEAGQARGEPARKRWTLKLTRVVNELAAAE